MLIYVLNKKKVRAALQTLPQKIRADMINDVNRIAKKLNPKNPKKPMNVSIGEGVWYVTYKRKAKFAALFYVVDADGLQILHITQWHSCQKNKIDNQDILDAAKAYRQLL